MPFDSKKSAFSVWCVTMCNPVYSVWIESNTQNKFCCLLSFAFLFSFGFQLLFVCLHVNIWILTKRRFFSMFISVHLVHNGSRKLLSLSNNKRNETERNCKLISNKCIRKLLLLSLFERYDIEKKIASNNNNNNKDNSNYIINHDTLGIQTIKQWKFINLTVFYFILFIVIIGFF